MRTLKRGAAALLAAVAIAVVGAAAPASATTTGDEDEPIQLGMNVVGYDEKVAEANGFEIVTYPDGSWASVAVTEEAKAIEAAAGGPEVYNPGAPTTNYVAIVGDCGTSWIDVGGSWSNRYVDTGYSVKAPVYNRINWVVQVASLGGFPWLQWPNGSSGAVWSSRAYFDVGTWGGSAWVRNDSSVQLITGLICSSGGPAETF